MSKAAKYLHLRIKYCRILSIIVNLDRRKYMKFYNRISKICKGHKKVALFVDMDGTIVEYSVFPDGFVTTETKEVFLNAEPLEVVLNNLKKVSEIENLDVYILSLARSFIIVEEKKQWLKKYAPFIKEENYILLNKENGDYNAENREFIKSIKMKEKLDKYDYVMLLDDDHKILRRALNEIGKNGEVFHVSSATM